MLLPCTKAADQGLGINLDLQHCENLGGFAFGVCVVDKTAQCAGFAGQEDVLRHRQRGDQAHFLKVHGDPGSAGRLGRVGGQGRTPDHYRSGVRFMDPVQHLQNGGFPRPIAAKKGVDLTGKNLEIHIFQGFDTAKSLGNPRHDDS